MGQNMLTGRCAALHVWSFPDCQHVRSVRNENGVQAEKNGKATTAQNGAAATSAKKYHIPGVPMSANGFSAEQLNAMAQQSAAQQPGVDFHAQYDSNSINRLSFLSLLSYMQWTRDCAIVLLRAVSSVICGLHVVTRCMWVTGTHAKK